MEFLASYIREPKDAGKKKNLHRELFWCRCWHGEVRRGTQEICSLRTKVKVTKTNNAKTIQSSAPNYMQ